jgi:hypothetical protein
VIVTIWLAIWARSRESASPEIVARPALRLLDMPGCYRLSSQPWPDGTDGVRALPEHFMLVADSLDEWGRTYDTYRAEPLDGVRDEAYRWFVRADTLWVVWAEADVRGGLALRRSGDGLLGRVRVGGGQAAVDVTARVQAWRVNCGTREIESTTRVRR